MMGYGHPFFSSGCARCTVLTIYKDGLCFQCSKERAPSCPRCESSETATVSASGMEWSNCSSCGLDFNQKAVVGVV